MGHGEFTKRVHSSEIEGLGVKSRVGEQSGGVHAGEGGRFGSRRMECWNRENWRIFCQGHIQEELRHKSYKYIEIFQNASNMIINTNTLKHD